MPRARQNRPRVGRGRGACVIFVLLAGWAAAPAVVEVPPAAARLAAAVARAPEPGPTFDRLVAAWPVEAGLDGLAEHWAEQLAEAPEDRRSALRLALALVRERQGRLEEALELAREVGSDVAQGIRAGAAAARLLARLGRLEEAAEATAALLAGGGLPPLRELELRLELARLRERLHDRPAALAAWQELAARFGDDPTVVEEAAQALLLLSEPAAAAALYETAESAAGDPAGRLQLRLRRAQAVAAAGDAAAARALLGGALDEADPASPLAGSLRAALEETFRRARDDAGLLAWYGDRAAARPHETETLWRLAELQAWAGRPEAVAAAQALADAFPNQSAAQLRAAAILADARAWDAAEALLAAWAERPDGPPEAALDLGRLRWRRAELEPSAEALRAGARDAWAAAARRPGAPPAARLRAAALLQAHGFRAEAAEAGRRAVADAPDDFEARAQVAGWLAQAGDRAGARALIEAHPRPWGLPVALRAAQFLDRAGESAAALAVTSAGVGEFPDAFPLLDLHLRLLARAGRTAEALPLFPRLAALAAGTGARADVEGRHLAALREAGALEGWLDRARAALATLGEYDLALLARAQLDADDLPGAAATLAAAGPRWEVSPVLAERRAELLARTEGPAAAAAFWETQAEVQPARAAPYLRQAAQAWLRLEQPARALAATERWARASPADHQAQNLRAEVLWRLGRAADGNAAQREAARLAPQPYEPLLRLGRELVTQGRLADAIGVFFEAYDAADGPAARQAVLRPLTDAHLAAGRLPELVEAFGRRLRPGEHERELAEVFLAAQDTRRARAALERARAADPSDLALARQLRTLAEQDADWPEAVRWARLLAEREPGPGPGLALLRALLAAGQTDEAARLLAAHGREWVRDSAAWRDLAAAAGDGPGRDLVRQALDARLAEAVATDPRQALALAETLLAQGDRERARPLLEAALTPPPEPRPSPARRDDFGAEMTLAVRAREFFQAALAGGGPAATSAAGGPYRSLREAQIAARVYLAGLAALEGRDEPFLDGLAGLMRTRGDDLPDRAMAWLHMQARLRYLAELDTLLAAPAADPAFLEFNYEVLTNTVGLDRAGPEAARMSALAEALLTRLLEDPAGDPVDFVLRQADRLIAFSGRAEAQALLERAAAGPARLAPAGALRLAQRLASLGAAKGVLPLLERGLAGPPGDPSLEAERRALLVPVAQALAAAAPGERRLDLLDRALRLHYGRDETAAVVEPRAWLAAPTPHPWLSPGSWYQLQQVFGLARAGGLAVELGALLQRQRAELGGDEAVSAAVTSALFLASGGDPAGAAAALAALAGELGGEPHLRLLAADHWRLARRPERAWAELAGAEGAPGVLGQAAGLRRLKWLAQEGRQAELEAAAGAYLDRRLPPEFALAAGALLQLDQPVSAVRTARAPAPSAGPTLPPGPAAVPRPAQRPTLSPAQEARLRLNTARAARDPAALAEAAQAVLRAGGQTGLLGQTVVGDPTLRRDALAGLREAGALDAYEDSLRAQLASAPDSLRLLEALAEAARYREDAGGRRPGEPPRSLEYLARLAELRPANEAYRREWESRLFALGRFAELAERLAPRLREDFWSAAGGGLPLPEIFLEAGRLDELVGAAEAAPLGLDPASAGPRGQLLLQLGGRFQQLGAGDAAVRLWRRAVASPEAVGGLEALQRLLAAAPAAPAQADDLRAYFLPPLAGQVAAVTWLGRQTERDLPPWAGLQRQGDGRARLAVVALLRAAQPAAVRALLAAARKRRDAPTPDRADLPAHLTALTAAVALRDAAALADAAALFALLDAPATAHGAFYDTLLAGGFYPGLAAEVFDWPGREDLAIGLLERLSAALPDRVGGGPGPRFDAQLRILELARRGGLAERAAAAAAEAAGLLRAHALGQSGLVDPPAALALANALLDFGRPDEAAGWLEQLEAHPQWQNDADLVRRAAVLRARLLRAAPPAP